jgi:pyruvate ferredoxin oxidoreductase gamma subunit
VTAAELLASAAFREDRYAQAIPSFGSERMGAPVTAFCRIDHKPIRTHEPVTEPDALPIQDPMLLHEADLFAGLKPPGDGPPRPSAARRADARRCSPRWPAW